MPNEILLLSVKIDDSFSKGDECNPGKFYVVVRQTRVWLTLRAANWVTKKVDNEKSIFQNIIIQFA